MASVWSTVDQPFGELVKTGRILDTPLFDYIDASQTVSRTWAAFLLKVPDDYRGVARVTYQQERLKLTEHGQDNPRTLTLNAGRLFEN